MARNAIVDVKKSGPNLPFEVHAYQSFVVGLKLYWTRSIYEHVANETKALDLDDPRAIERKMRASVIYQYYGWLEHYLQQYKFLGRWGLMSMLEKQNGKLSRILDQYAREDPDRLRLDPELKLPQYYRLADFHQIPGGVWSDACDAFAYELGSQTTTPTHDSDADLHLRYARYLRDLCAPQKVLDQGCGFGKTTLPLKKELPQAEVVGCDLSEPCLKLGHARAVEQQLPVDFVQCGVENLKFADASFDAITGSMLLHEMPPSAIRQSFKEARRVLKGGGYYTQLDFYDPPGGAVGEFIFYGHSARNREPYMVPLCKLNLVKELEKAGFTDVRIEPFEEADGALASGRDLPRQWRFPWTMIVARAA